MTPAQEVVIALLKKFPDAPTKTLANIAYAKHPEMWKTPEGARDCVRNLRGAHGEARRNRSTIKEFFREPQAPGDPFSKIPEGLVHFDDWKAVQFDGPMRVLVLGDAHIPYHDRSAVVLALETGRKHGVDTVLWNGDALDFFSLSFWDKDPRKRDWEAELEIASALFTCVRECFPKARIIFKDGNHEERYERYMRVKAPELLNVKKFKLSEVLGFPNLGIDDHVSEKRPIRLGNLNVIHGHEYNFAISNPVNPARGFFLRAKVHCIGSHFHQVSQHSEKNMEDKVISTWSTGCLSDIHPDYRPLNSWGQGFAIVDVDKHGAFEVHNYRIIDGKAYA